jgi:hypothetical protein
MLQNNPTAGRQSRITVFLTMYVLSIDMDVANGQELKQGEAYEGRNSKTNIPILTASKIIFNNRLEARRLRPSH